MIAQLARRLPLSRLVQNFLYVIVDRRRVDILSDMAEAFETVLDERAGIVRAKVTSAAPLNDTQRQHVHHELSKVAKRQIRVDYATDPDLIGGIVARIGSTVYDGSVRTQLQTLRQRLTAAV